MKIEEMAGYMKSRREQRRQQALQDLGGMCVVCGVTEGLEFDHVSPDTKLANICDMLSHGNDRFWNEVAKCQLLCRSHHDEKSKREGNYGGGQNKIIDPQHGSSTLYNGGCRCEECRLWKKLYRNGEVTTQGLPR